MFNTEVQTWRLKAISEFPEIFHFRTCRPPHNETAELQEMVGVSKQLYLKVFQEKDYRPDYLVASSVLGGTTILLVITALIQRQKSERVDHL